MVWTRRTVIQFVPDQFAFYEIMFKIQYSAIHVVYVGIILSGFETQVLLWYLFTWHLNSPTIHYPENLRLYTEQGGRCQELSRSACLLADAASCRFAFHAVFGVDFFLPSSVR